MSSDSFNYTMSRPEFQDFLAAAITLRVPFRYQRYGDGEFACMGDWVEPRNREHEYTMGLRIALIESMARPAPATIYGVGVPGKHWAKTQECLKAMEMEPDSLPWVPATTFTEPAEHGRLGPFFKALQGRDLILIGPKYMGDLPKWLLEFKEHIVIPNQHCFRNLTRILNDTTAAISKGDVRHDAVVLVVASLPAAYIIHTLGQLPACMDMSFIDMGSGLDHYVGKKSRSMHSRCPEIWAGNALKIKEYLAK